MAFLLHQQRKKGLPPLYIFTVIIRWTNEILFQVFLIATFTDDRLRSNLFLCLFLNRPMFPEERVCTLCWLLFSCAVSPTTTHISCRACLFSFMQWASSGWYLSVSLPDWQTMLSIYHVNRFLSSFLTNENSPFIFVDGSIFVPLYVTLAPIGGSFPVFRRSTLL